MSIETECKIPVPALAPVTRRLETLGATRRADSRRERNEVFDTPDATLLHAGSLLRLRTWPGTPGGVVTVKRARSREGTRFKSREEIETRVDDADAARRQFSALGYVAAKVYEKDRAEWEWRGAHIALDVCPEMGSFVEVEGGDALIGAVLADLGIDPDGHRPENYLLLWEKHLARRGETAWRDMVFGESSTCS